ncbi:MAG: dienelactone hydrolase family protein [Deltaproteobacteria bacterium]|nr:dienelactone hydrolase family protein [Deltaproteobacteria bacterium]
MQSLNHRKKITLFCTTLALAWFGASPVQAKNITYKVDKTAYEGYIVNKGKDAPLVILVHDWDGLTGYEIKRAHMLGDLGYSVLAIDLFGKGVRPTELKDKQEHTGQLYKDRTKMRALLSKALDVAKKNNLNLQKAVAIGYCFGGAAVLEMARAGMDLDAFVTFHGGLSTPEGQDYAQTKGKVMVFHGSADSMISMDDFANLTKALETNKVPHEMTTYSQTPHAFTVFDSPSYTQEADKHSWTRFLALLKTL